MTAPARAAALALAASILAACALPEPPRNETALARDRALTLVVATLPGEDNAPAGAELAARVAVELRLRGVEAWTLAGWLGRAPEAAGGLTARLAGGSPGQAELEWLAGLGVERVLALRVERADAEWSPAGRRAAVAVTATLTPTALAGRTESVTVLAETDGPAGLTFRRALDEAAQRVAEAALGLWRRAP